MSMGSALCVCTSVFLNPNLFPVLQSNTVIIPMIILVLLLTLPWRFKKFHSIMMYRYMIFETSFMSTCFFKYYKAITYCIYNIILFCIYLLYIAFLQSIKVHVNVYILPSINTLALRCVKIIN